MWWPPFWVPFMSTHRKHGISGVPRHIHSIQFNPIQLIHSLIFSAQSFICFSFNSKEPKNVLLQNRDWHFLQNYNLSPHCFFVRDEIFVVFFLLDSIHSVYSPYDQFCLFETANNGLARFGAIADCFYAKSKFRIWLLFSLDEAEKLGLEVSGLEVSGLEMPKAENCRSTGKSIL
jgi:hypothetical protein